MAKIHYYIIILLCLLTTVDSHAQDTLRVGYSDAPPFVISQNDNVNGVSIYLWERIAQELSLDFQFVPLDFSDMLSALESGDIDISINPLTVSSSRMENIDFGQTFFASHSVIARAQTSGLERIKNLFKSLFSSEFIGTFCILFSLIFVFGFLTWVFERKTENESFRKDHKGIWDGLWWSVVTMTTVGYGDKAPVSSGGKTVALIWMIIGLLFISGFTASIASSLTLTRIENSEINIQKISKKSVGTISSSSSEEFLRSHNFREIKDYENIAEALQDLQKKKIDFFIYDEPILRNYLDNHLSFSDITITPQKFKSQFYAFGYQKGNDSLRNIIDQKTMQVIERKDWQYILKEYNCVDDSH